MWARPSSSGPRDVCVSHEPSLNEQVVGKLGAVTRLRTFTMQANDDMLPYYQSMVEQLASSPGRVRKFKLYAKAFSVFVALVIFWYAHYEVLGDMLIGKIVSRIAAESRQSPGIVVGGDDEGIGGGNATEAGPAGEGAEDRIEGWVTLTVGQFWFWFGVLMLVATQECSHSFAEPAGNKASEDAAPGDVPLEPVRLRSASGGEGEGEGDGEVLGRADAEDAHARAEAPPPRRRCFQIARDGWKTPWRRIAMWNWNCMLGVLAWMGLDLTCDAVHMLLHEIQSTRFWINVGFLVAANLIVITLDQIDPPPAPASASGTAPRPRGMRRSQPFAAVAPANTRAPAPSNGFRGMPALNGPASIGSKRKLAVRAIRKVQALGGRIRAAANVPSPGSAPRAAFVRLESDEHAAMVEGAASVRRAMIDADASGEGDAAGPEGGKRARTANGGVVEPRGLAGAGDARLTDGDDAFCVYSPTDEEGEQGGGLGPTEPGGVQGRGRDEDFA